MGSASQPMLVVKYNRSLLKKRRGYKDIREAYESNLNDTQLKFKELTPLQQKKIRDKIIEQAKRDKIQTIQHYLIAIFLTILLGFVAYSLFS
jgi:hypothetical protein